MKGLKKSRGSGEGDGSTINGITLATPSDCSREDHISRAHPVDRYVVHLTSRVGPRSPSSQIGLADQPA